MLDDSSVNDNKAEIELSRRRGLVRWCWAIVVSALVTVLVCALTPVKFASSEQLLLSLFVIFATWFVLKVFSSRGKFRFVSLLGLMAFTAFLCMYILAPLRDRTEQNAAIELLRSQGGEVVFGRFADKYPTEPMGWVPGQNGIPFPAALHYFEQNYHVLHLSDLSRLSASIGVWKEPLESLYILIFTHKSSRKNPLSSADEYANGVIFLSPGFASLRVHWVCSDCDSTTTLGRQ